MVTIEQIGELNDELIDSIYELKQQLSGKHRFSPLQYQHVLTNPSATVIGAFDNKQLVGVAILNKVTTLSSTIGDIDDVVVLDAYRGQGIASRILDVIVGHAKEEGIHVLRLTSAPSRVAANRLYQQYGFKQKDTNSYRYFVK